LLSFWKKHYLWVLMLTVVILGTVLLVQLGTSFSGELSLLQEKKLLEVQGLYRSLVGSYANFARFLFEREIDQPHILELLDVGWNQPENRDWARSTLLQTLSELNTKLQQYDFRQLHFHFPDGTSFLRMHRPEKYGDPLFEVRDSIRLANQRGEFVSGFEEGRIYNGFRFVFPLPYGADRGTVEVSISFTTLCMDLVQDFQNPFYFLLDEITVLQTVFEEEQHNYQESQLLPGYVLDKETYESVKGFSYPNPYPWEDIFEEARRQIPPPPRDPEGFVIDMTLASEPYVLAFFPVENVRGKQVGYLLSLERDSTFHDTRKKNTISLASTFLGVVFVVLLVFFMNRSRHNATEANRAKSEFLASMSHEIRTPMNGILATLDLLEDESDRNRRDDFFRILRSSASSLLQVINDILDFSKIEAGKMHVESIPFDLQELLQDVSGLIFASASQKGLQTSLQLEPNLPRYVRGDPVRLRQVLLNLLGNALKFTPQGSLCLRAWKETGAENGVFVRFAVRDTGVGIPRDKQHRLFSTFSQADSSVTRKFGGTGLGLAISKNLVEMMGGSIWMESEENKGSTFSFRLPFPIASAQEVPSKSPARGRFLQEGSCPRGLKVLVVDDNEVNRKVARALLEKLGWHVETVDSGKKCLDRVGQSTFQVILMDVMMPEMDGLEATRKLKKMPAPLSQIPVIGLSASVLERDRQSCFEAGMEGFAAKPIQLEELVGQILKVLPKDSASTASSPQPVHMAEILKHVDNLDFIYQEIAPTFFADWNQKHRDLQQALQEERWEQVELVSHSFKASSRYLGALELSRLFQDMEKESTAPQPRTDHLVQLLSQVEKEMREVETFFSQTPPP